jgi:hypothetical protein
LIDPNNTASDIWADTAYRATANETFLAGRLLRSQIHRKTPKGKPMPRRTARANARKSAVRAAVEHVFARQKGPMGLFIRTIGIARAQTKIGLANLLYNMQRMVWLTHQIAPSCATSSAEIRFGTEPTRALIAEITRSVSRENHPTPLLREKHGNWRCPALEGWT